MKQRLPLLLATGALAAFASGCASDRSAGNRASAQLVPTTGNNVSGTVYFKPVRNAVLVTGEVRGLKPNAEHGFHVHEHGDCSSGDGMSAGGHFNPTGQPHGSPHGGMHHAGDLPSLRADASGVARFQFEAPAITVGGGVTNVVGKGVIVHRDPDDFKSQPAGNAGPRLACGVILS